MFITVLLTRADTLVTPKRTKLDLAKSFVTKDLGYRPTGPPLSRGLISERKKTCHIPRKDRLEAKPAFETGSSVRNRCV
jgi:hypothetical protein